MGQQGLAASTIYQRGRGLARLAGRLPVPLLEATPVMLSAWRAGLRISDEAVHHYVNDVQWFYRWAVAEGLIGASPAEGLPRPRRARMLPRPIGEPALFTAVASAPPRVRPWLVLAGWAGLRAKEIAYLRRPQVRDRDEPPVLLVAHDATKGRRERTVPMCEFVLEELYAAGLPVSGWVFRRRDGGRGPVQPWTVSGLANEHLHACGFPETLHQLRHRFGTGTYRHQRDLRVVQELLGHSSPQTTAGYAAYDSTDAVAAVEALPAPRHLKAVSE
jgi:integrase/recombinase XerC